MADFRATPATKYLARKLELGTLPHGHGFRIIGKEPNPELFNHLKPVAVLPNLEGVPERPRTSNVDIMPVFPVDYPWMELDLFH